MRWRLLMVLTAVAMLFVSQASADVTASVWDSGFYPQEVGLNEWTTDYFVVEVGYDGTFVEELAWSCTYNWTITSVLCDGVDVTGDPAYYSASLDGESEDTCAVNIALATEGYYEVYVDVTVTYPD